jgi:hypothetical protein
MPQFLAIEPGDLASVARHHLARGDLRHLGVEPVHAAAVDLDRPDPDRDVGRVEIEGSAFVGGCAPEFPLAALAPITHVDEPHPGAELVGVGAEAFGALV